MPLDRCAVRPKLLNDPSNRMLARLADNIPQATGFKDRLAGKPGHRFFHMSDVGVGHVDNCKHCDGVLQGRFPFSLDQGSFLQRVRRS
jgi:hypothetical protein